MEQAPGREHRRLELVREDDRPFASLLPHGPVVGDPEDGIILLQEPRNPRDAALGCVWKVEPRNVGAISDAAVQQMATVLQGLFRSLLPGTTIQVLMHMAPTDRVDEWSEFRKGAPDLYSLNEFQQASLKEGLAHADGARRWRLRETTTLMTARLSAPIPDMRRQQRAFSLFRSDRKLLRDMNRLTETVLSRVVEELEDLRVLCESVLDMARVGHRRLDCQGIHREVSRLLQPWRREARCYDRELPMREQLLGVPARTTDHGSWVFGPDETVEEEDRAWEARVMSLQQAPTRTYPGMLSSLHAPEDAEPFAPWEALPDTPLTLVTQVGVPDQEDERSMLRQKRSFANIQKNTMFGEEDPEKVKLRDDLDRIMRDTTSYILHTRVHLVLWGRAERSMASTFSVVTQAGRRLGLEFMPETIIGHQLFLQCLPLGLNLKYPKDQMLRRSRRIPAISAAHLLPLYGDYTGSDTPAQLYVNARGEPRDLRLLRPAAAAHHRGGHVEVGQVLPGQPPDPAGAPPGRFHRHPRPLGLLRHDVRGLQGRVRRHRPGPTPVLQPVRRRPGLVAPHVPDGAHRPDGVRGGRPGRGRPGAGGQGGVLAGASGLFGVARGEQARRGAAAAGLL